MTDEEDPEVVADLQLRAASERDRSRLRSEAIYAWSEPAFVEHWPCRGAPTGCTAMVGITAEVVAARDAFNRQLRRRGEGDLLKSQIVLCDDCRRKVAEVRALKLRERIDATGEMIRELDGCDGDREREILDQLRRWGHDDVDGLARRIRDRRSAKAAKRRQL